MSDFIFILKSGRSIRANRGILGVSATERGKMFEGYDGEVLSALDADGESFDLHEKPLTTAERHEIGERMVDLWRAWILL